MTIQKIIIVSSFYYQMHNFDVIQLDFNCKREHMVHTLVFKFNGITDTLVRMVKTSIRVILICSLC